MRRSSAVPSGVCAAAEDVAEKLLDAHLIGKPKCKDEHYIVSPVLCVNVGSAQN